MSRGNGTIKLREETGQAGATVSAAPQREYPWLGLPSILILLATIFLESFVPDVAGQETPGKGVFVGILSLFLASALVFYGAGYGLGRISTPARRTYADISLVVSMLLLVWMLMTSKIGLLDPTIWPSPARAFQILRIDASEFLVASGASMNRLVRGFFLALVAAIPFGVIVGWHKRLFNLVYPIAKFIAPIPPVVYIPYALVVFPSIQAASVFVIFIGVFWPVFTNTIYGVAHVDKRLIEAAYTLGATDRTILRRVVVPAALPTIFAGVLIGIILGFIMVTIAETIGASTGIGYYLLYYKDVAAYPRVVADIFVIGMWTFVWTFVFDRVQRWSLRWQRGVVR